MKISNLSMWRRRLNANADGILNASADGILSASADGIFETNLGFSL